MSQNRQKNSEMRKSPVSGQKMAATKSSKAKAPKGRVSKPAAGKPLSNGVHEVTNGVGAGKMEDQTAKINLLTLQKMDSSVCGILATMPHVVLYEFKKAENVWVSNAISGTTPTHFLFYLGMGKGLVVTDYVFWTNADLLYLAFIGTNFI